ncbi:BaiN/RdsA family NAD(P)/FAD-dependent oxidoreductase [Kordiimonas aquimaris]|uniref:NAD(P)/FAD-dependent oxidoreductase n=1 Tax=Kordiimonas aquimaris TaxID=707591 RepID=UPI0021CF8789|nr:NAD(P)/FAD-dependent oxidoreductase [Kordiimonas aquimaris]
MKIEAYDVVVLGAGAAGLMCASTAAARGKTVLLIERNKKPGAKILISGGGRCNFTNEAVTASAYISENPHFAKSALSRYTQWDFMNLIASYGLTWHEKTLGQLFCDQGAKAILQVLLDECAKVGVSVSLETEVSNVEKTDRGFLLSVGQKAIEAHQLVVATGGASIPKMGATDFGYKLARQFGLRIVEPRPALVPLTFGESDVQAMKELAGVAVDTHVAVADNKEHPSFRENSLFTHRGLSGPAILQVSSYWCPSDVIKVNLLPDETDVKSWLISARDTYASSTLKTVLSEKLPSRLAEQVTSDWPGKMAELSNASLDNVARRVGDWRLKPVGTEGFGKAEVTKGGVATDALSSKTMEVKKVPGLYFIGECVDVTGWLGGYNFQWAWASGHAAGQAV